MLLLVTTSYIIIFSSGVIGNALVVMVVKWNKDLRNSTNYFLVNLSIADCLVLIICMPSAIVDLYARDQWFLGSFMCKFELC